MKYKEVRRLLGTIAIVTTTSLTACGAESTQPIETSVEAEVTQEVEEPTPTPMPTETKITVSYEQSSTDSDELNLIGDDVSYIIKDYIAPLFYETLSGHNYDFRLDDESVYIGDALASENVDFRDDGTLWVRDMVIADSIPVVKYVRMSDTEVEARYIGLAPKDSNMVSGITFVMEKGDDDIYHITDLLGVFGESIKDLRTYEGTFDGWAMELGGQPVYDVGDEIKISGGMTLYPHFTDNDAMKVANEDGTCVEGQLEEIDGQAVLRVVHINGTKKDKDGNIVAIKKYALTGLDAKKDKVKGVDKDTVEKQQTEEADPSVKPEAKKPSDVKPGADKPAPKQPVDNTPATDNSNKDPDYGSASDADWAAMGVTEVQECYGGGDYSDGADIHFE